MNLYEYQRSRSFFDIGPRSLRFNIFKFFSLETAGPSEAKFPVALHGIGEWMVIQMVQDTWPIWLPCPYMVIAFKIFFSGTKRPMTLKVDMQPRINEYYKFVQMMTLGRPCPIYGHVKFDPLCFCMGKKDKTMNFSETIVVCDIKVGRCSQLNEYMNLYKYVKVIH